MGNPIVVYGSRMLTAMLYHGACRHPDFNVAAFAQDEGYLDPSGRYLGLPQVPFAEVTRQYPPHSHDMIVLTASYHDMRHRDSLYRKAQALGYAGGGKRTNPARSGTEAL